MTIIKFLERVTAARCAWTLSEGATLFQRPVGALGHPVGLPLGEDMMLSVTPRMSPG